MPENCPISVLIPALNEAANLPACIASVGFCDEIVVVDSGSTDASCALARDAGATVVDFHWNGQFPKKKNWALERFPWRNEWVLILDADERITPALAAELKAAVASPAFDGYYLNRRFYFLDGWLNHCGYFPSWNLRFFRHRLGRYETPDGQAQTDSGDNEVHEHILLGGRTGYLSAPMEHYAFPSIAVWVEKHNRYSNWEARANLVHSGAGHKGAIEPGLSRKRRLKSIARSLPFRPTLRFLYHFVWRAGILDGYRGYIFCRLLAFYEFLSVAKVEELKRRNPDCS
jgi:glycosyltransferase involved in cell wall biosynthesis